MANSNRKRGFGEHSSKARRKNLTIQQRLSDEDVVVAVDFWFSQPHIDLTDMTMWEGLRDDLQEKRKKLFDVELLRRQWGELVDPRLNRLCKVPSTTKEMLGWKKSMSSEEKFQVLNTRLRNLKFVRERELGRTFLREDWQPSGSRGELINGHLAERGSSPVHSQSNESLVIIQEFPKVVRNDADEDDDDVQILSSPPKRAKMGLNESLEIYSLKFQCSLPLKFAGNQAGAASCDVLGWSLPKGMFAGKRFHVLKKPGDWEDASAGLGHEYFIVLHGGTLVAEENVDADTIVIKSKDDCYNRSGFLRFPCHIYEADSIYELVKKPEFVRVGAVSKTAFNSSKYIVMECLSDCEEWDEVGGSKVKKNRRQANTKVKLEENVLQKDKDSDVTEKADERTAKVKVVQIDDSNDETDDSEKESKNEAQISDDPPVNSDEDAEDDDEENETCSEDASDSESEDGDGFVDDEAEEGEDEDEDGGEGEEDDDEEEKGGDDDDEEGEDMDEEENADEEENDEEEEMDQEEEEQEEDNEDEEEEQSHSDNEEDKETSLVDVQNEEDKTNDGNPKVAFKNSKNEGDKENIDEAGSSSNEKDIHMQMFTKMIVEEEVSGPYADNICRWIYLCKRLDHWKQSKLEKEAFEMKIAKREASLDAEAKDFRERTKQKFTFWALNLMIFRLAKAAATERMDEGQFKRFIVQQFNLTYEDKIGLREASERINDLKKNAVFVYHALREQKACLNDENLQYLRNVVGISGDKFLD